MYRILPDRDPWRMSVPYLHTYTLVYRKHHSVLSYIHTVAVLSLSLSPIHTVFLVSEERVSERSRRVERGKTSFVGTKTAPRLWSRPTDIYHCNYYYCYLLLMIVYGGIVRASLLINIVRFDLGSFALDLRLRNASVSWENTDQTTSWVITAPAAAANAATAVQR